MTLAKFLTATHDGRVLVGLIIGALVVGGLFLAALTCVPPRYRKWVVMAITFLGGLYLSLEFLLPHQPLRLHGGDALWGTKAIARFATGLSNARPNVASWAMVIGSFALLLGTSNLLQIHGKAIRKRNEGWYNSLAFYVSFFFILIVGFLKKYPVTFLSHHSAQRLQAVCGDIFMVLFNGFFQSLDSTMFSLIAFYIVSAAYRAFRVRSAEAALMMVTAAIIMLGLVPVGAMITSWLPKTGWASTFRLEQVSIWLLTWPNMAVQRAIEFGLAVGAMAMSLRVWLSLERGSFFDRQL